MAARRDSESIEAGQKTSFTRPTAEPALQFDPTWSSTSPRFATHGVYQIGLVQALSWIVRGTAGSQQSS